MGRQTGIPAALKRYGVKYETVPGWRTRGSSSFNPRGVVCHWTAGPRNAKGRPSLNVVTYGRPGLSGPLCQVYLDRNGVAVVVAAGRANHAGRGGYRGMSGNTQVFGIEAECGGDGDWTDAQRREYPKVVAALVSLTGRSHKYVCGHNEWTSRKIDIRDWPMSRMRSEVKAVLDGRGFTPGKGGGGGGTYGDPKKKHKVGSRVMGLYDGGTDVKWLQEELKKLNRYTGGKVDSLFGPALESAVRHYQRSRGLDVDGLAGKDTISALKSGAKKIADGKPEKPKSSGKAPKFPLPSGWYFGPKSGPNRSVSGYYGNRDHLRTWQRRMKDRGWTIAVDGLYGDQTARVARQFQAEKGLGVDGLIGKKTWAAAWEEPVT